MSRSLEGSKNAFIRATHPRSGSRLAPVSRQDDVLFHVVGISRSGKYIQEKVRLEAFRRYYWRCPNRPVHEFSEGRLTRLTSLLLQLFVDLEEPSGIVVHLVVAI